MQGDLSAGDIAAHFPITKASISHHLSALKEAGLVQDERHGQNIYYSLNPTVFQDALGWIVGFLPAGQRPKGGKKS
ncbi:MAG: metalloregulator ArsR/SmtB family transcription factor [Symbiobacteriia bacterium]